MIFMIGHLLFVILSMRPNVQKTLRAMNDASTWYHPDLFGEFAGVHRYAHREYAGAMKYFLIGAYYADKLSELSIGLMYLNGEGVSASGGAVVSYGGHKWTAKWWTQGDIPDNPMLNMRPNSLIWGARYDLMMQAFGGHGSDVEDPKDLRGALDEAMNFKGPALVNVKLSQGSQRKAQEFRWHS